MKIYILLAATILATLPSIAQTDEFRKAVNLYDKEVLAPSATIFDKIADQTGKADPHAYSLLCDVRSMVPGYENRMDAFFAEYPYSILAPQIRYAHALNLFNAEKYSEAVAQFALIKTGSLYKSQRAEYLFKKAYSHLETGDHLAASEGFEQVEKMAHSDYSAPSVYALGYIEYSRQNFEGAIGWFEKSRKDDRFKEMSTHYIFECKFMMKDYAYVIEKGRALFEAAPSDRKPHLARMISEAYLVEDDVSNAHIFYTHTLGSQSGENNRADLFFRGTLLFAVKDYKGAVENFRQMEHRTDSIGQIASYNLGYSYIQIKDKVSAMNAFKEASALGYDSKIEEDALFNYAKLAYDLNNDISGIETYLKKYTAKDKADMIYGYMAVAALRSRDYEAAVDAFDKIDELDVNMRSNYMKSNYLRANQLIRQGSYRNAVPCLKAAAYYSEKSSPFNQLARFWLAESYYRDNQFVKAREVYSDLYNLSALHGRAESWLIPYNIAYCYFKERNYAAARKWFTTYLTSENVVYRKEALLRKADCEFVEMKYKAAAAAYDEVLNEYFDVDDIYPYYQSALSYGLIDKVERKVELLANVMSASPEAEFYPEALFELGRTYAVKEDDQRAFDCFRRLAATVKDSNFVAKAYIEMGTLARNQSMFNEALGYYKTVVEQMPLSGYADDALQAIESIYQTKNDPQAYLAYIDSIGKGGVKTEDEKETMIFNAAEQIFLSENYQKTLTSLQSYKETYPQGKYVYKADFYMAESYRTLGRYEEACDSYRKVIDGGEGSFVELSMLNFADLSFRLEKWADAFMGYSSLYEAAKLPNNQYVASLGMFRSAYRNHDWSNAIKWTRHLLAGTLADDVTREAEYVLAKSCLASSMRDEAFEILARLAADKNDAYGAEAAYLLIMDCYDRGAFEEVETKVYEFADSGTGQNYWKAKCFIVLGDSFAERDDMEQAKATFESIRDAYVPSGEEDDVLDNVSFRLKRIEELANQES